MKTFVVYHRINTRDWCKFDHEEALATKTHVETCKDFRKVAEVTCKNPWEAYVLTQNFKGPWTEAAGVKASGNDHRSTSVGDLIMDTETGDVFLPTGFEFTPVTFER